MTLTEIINKVAQETKINPEIISKTYKNYWIFIRNSVQELPLKEDLSESEFLNLKTNFNIPSLGKLSCTYDRYKGVNKRFEYIKNLRKRYEETNQY